MVEELDQVARLPRSGQLHGDVDDPLLFLRRERP
jgi:hypothetical protein